MILVDFIVRLACLAVVALFVLGTVAYLSTRDHAIDDTQARHPAGRDLSRLDRLDGVDDERLQMMLAIRDAEEAWDRDVWGERR